jgi:uncharacterized repeat protein (TIGR01451 family)
MRCALGIALLFVSSFLVSAVGQVAGPSQMVQCDQETFTITLENTSPTQSACDIVITATPPVMGFSYVVGTGTVTLHDLPGPIAADPDANAWDIDAIVGSDYELPPGEQISIAFDLAADCSAESGNIEVQIDYADCGTAQPYQELDSLSIEVLPGALVITKTPSVQDASVGDQVTWTITVESSGLGTIWNVEATDVLGSGLAYVSNTGGGVNVGQTTTWDLGDIAAGDSISFDITAEVVGCSDLINTADARWGCGPGEICYDTRNPGSCGCPSATASLNLIVENPALSFTPPNVTVAYCTNETPGLVQLTNSGIGTARNVELCCEFAHLEVDPTRPPPGTTYAAGCFQLPDIDPGTTFDLTFYILHADIDWCAGGPNGDNVFQLAYTNDCDIPFVAYPQFSTLSSESGPALDVTKTGPASLRLGETGSYDITVSYVGDLTCGNGSAEPVTVIDTYPAGFTVVDPDGGAVDGGARTITWSWTPDPATPFTRTVQLEAPTDCTYCAQPGGGSDPNSVTATATDCCGCSMTASAEAPTTILCEGYGDDSEYFSSSMSLDRTTTVRCSGDYAVTVTHTYTFLDDSALDDFLLNEFTYFVDGGGDLLYSVGTASVTGATLGTVVDNTPTGRLELPLADATAVRGKTIEYTYTLTVLGLDDPSCQATSYPIYTGIEIEPGATPIGYCGTMYADPPVQTAVAQPPAMSVSIDGIPTVQEHCATYDVTITLTKTSILADPYDVRLVLTNNGNSLIDLSGALCSGVSPTDGTSCVAPIEGTDTYEWRFADGFVAGDTATIGPIRVTVPCSGPLADLSVVATFDDLCYDDTTYGDACSTSSSDAASLSLSADVFTRKSPEVLFATERYVTWSLVVHNTGNGTAYNVWVDDVLGSGLIFDQSNTSPAGATVSANLDHTGAPINGASFLFDEVAAGELKTITFAAELVGCDDLTNDVEVSWGCGGSDCQTPRTDSSSVLTPSVNMVSTSYAPTPLDVCTTSSATVTAKNAGVGTVYNVAANVTLPTGLEYINGTAEYRTYVFGETPGSWIPTADPSGVPGPNLVWTPTEIGALESVAPDVVVEIQYGVSIGCDFPGGNLQFHTSYENPCGDTFDSNVGSFSMSARVPDVTVDMVQAPDDAIPCGASATWTITVTNDGPVSAPYVRVVSTLGSGWSYTSSTGGGSNVGQVTTWVINDLGSGASTVLTITADSAAAGGGNCDNLNHQVQSFWACDAAETQCLSSAADTTSIVGARTPPITVAATLAPDSVEVCTDTTTFTLTVANGSATAAASYVDARVTLPSGLSYVTGTTEIDCGSGFVSSPDPAIDGQQLTWYDTATDGGASDACATLAANGQVRIRFDVDSSCYFTAASANSRVFYYDCCGETQTQRSRNDTIGSDQPNLTITKTPDMTDAVCGDTVTWTIQVINTSADAIAEVVRIEDFLGANLSYVSSTGGAVEINGGQILYPTPPAYGAAYGWELGSLAPLASTSVTISAQLTAPADCADALRTNTAAVTWACGAPDGNPTTADYDCESNEWNSASNRVPMPNLEIDSSDITPSFTCSGDGVTPGSGEIEIVVRNTGDASIPLGSDFTITVTEMTTGYSAIDTFTNLGGTLPLAAGGSDTLVFPWAVACASCAYAVNVALDTLDGICECDETDNSATRNETITLPDLVVDSAGLSVICAGDGQIRIQGPVTLRNDGCGAPLTGTVRVRFRLYDAADCAGNQIDTFTVDLSGLSIASGGGTQQRTIDATRALDVCGATEASILIEADDNDAICECDGANNTLCAGPFAVALPDLAITNTTVSVPTACDVGTVDVTIRNVGSADAPAGSVVRITGDAAGEATTPLLSPGASTVVTVPLDVPLACGPKSIAATVDPDGTLCECSAGSNGTNVNFTVSDPDLVVSGLVAACRPDGTVRVTATISNDGDEVSGDVTVRVLLDGSPIDSATIALAPSATYAVDVMTDPVSCGVEHAIQVDVDATDEVCECDETNNVLEANATCPCPALSVDKIITDIVRNGSSIGTTGPIEPGDVIFYRYTITNVAAGTATRVEFTDTLPAGLVYETDAPGIAASYSVTSPSAGGFLGLLDGASTFTTSIDATLHGGASLVADYTVRATSDVTQGDDLINVAATTGETPDGSAIPGENVTLGDTSDGDAEDPDPDDTGITVVGAVEPALSVDKTITDIDRPGVGSIGIAGPVEPGDVVFYRFVIRNVGGGTAYNVGFADTLPPGVVIETGTILGDGTYTVTGPAASGSLGLADGVATFTASIGAEIAGGEALTAEFAAEVTSGIIQGVDLVNTAEATGEDGFGSEIPDGNPDAGDIADDDVEDPDADDTGIAIIPAEEPALSVDKIITDIVRRGSSIGAAGPVEPGDVILYRYTIRNVGLGTAYAVDFADALPTGLVIETDAPGSPGSYVVTSPAASGSLELTDGTSAFTTSTAATIGGGEQLVAEYAVLVTSNVRQSVDLVNVAATTGIDGAGNAIPGENADVGDTSDDDEEDPDADDTGITVVTPVVPALTIDKRVVDILRDGASVGVVDPVLYDDVIVYRTTIRNVGLGTAYDVEFTDTLPAGLAIETGAAPGAGSYVVTYPTASGSLGLSDGAPAFTTSIDATIAGGESLTATYAAIVTPAAPPAIDLVNIAETTGEDGAGTEIPDENADVGDTSDDDEEDPDADDTGIATVRVGAPAFVTRKAVVEIRRQGLDVGGDVVEPGDIVTYEVGVANVGDGPAFRVDLFDELPPGFVYEGNSSATWPSGASTADPLGAPGPLLSWPVDASLESDEELVLRFDAFVTSDITQGAAYINTITATGEDGAGEEIPPDHSDLVPEDDDPDDSSDVPLLGAVPALVTDKSILDVERGGRSLGAIGTIEEGDVITYALRITNVGLGTAYDVDVRDLLPAPFEYIVGTTVSDWPFRAGRFTADPSGAPGPTLLWDTDATLAYDESIDLTFDASIAGPVDAGTTYTNVLIATGRDGADNDIEADNADDVPEDDDPDDRDDVSVVAVDLVPALVTTKRVTAVFRDGVSTPDRMIEEGDVVRFELSVRNVGPATAYEVGIDDRLPLEFEYVPGTTRSAWPRGSASSDPRHGAGGWIWDLAATLSSGQRLILTFDARVLGPLFDGALYTNRMHAFGEDATGDRIPEDQRDVVPSDTDPDDASDVGLTARSSYIEGEGGRIAVPILRKTAEVLAGGTCEGWTTEVDRVWFQTDVAMLAAAEFERLATAPSTWAALPETLLPTWLRTVQAQGVAAARDNLLQVDGLSSLGVPLSKGPRIVRLAERSGVPAETALAMRLDELAARAGLVAGDRPADERWIVLEYAEGEPIYTGAIDGPRGPVGDWTIVDERIVPSALGMGLLEQASAAGSFLVSGEPLDRYLGWVLIEIMANKLIALDEALTIREGTAVPYVPHVGVEASEGGYVVEDANSYLFDQLALLWGLAKTVELVDGMSDDARALDAALWSKLRETAARLIGEVLEAIEVRHVSSAGDLLDRSEGGEALTVNLGLLLGALEAARDAILVDARLDILFDRALEQLVARQADNSLFAVTADVDPASFVDLRSQFAGIRGLLAGYAATGIADYAARAQETFDALDKALWIDRAAIGFYANGWFDNTRTTCYTPLDIALAVGALRELAGVSTSERRSLVLSRLTGFVRSIVDEAALQLSNALPADSDITVGVGRHEIAPIESDLRTIRLAPVFQQRLCLEETETDETCGGWDAIDHEPWYQTDISMYAAHVLQDRLPGFEDVADANLVAVAFHAGLGVPFDSIAAMRDVAADDDDAVEPIALPFASASPRLASANDLAWSNPTFDTRVVASAVGMTLLREAQEVRQAFDDLANDPERAREARLLMGAIAETIGALLDVRIDGPAGAAYIPHASAWDASDDRLIPMEEQSGLFGQAALLWGLSETYALLRDPQAADLLEPWDRDATTLAAQTADLIGTVLLTLEIAHLDPVVRVLVDDSDPSDDRWILGTEVTTVNLGVASSALEASIGVLGPASSDGRRAVSLLTAIADFVRTRAWRGIGEVVERIDLERSGAGTCESETLAGQLGALRVLVAARRWLGLSEDAVSEAVRAIDARFWDPDLRLYRAEPERIEWCVSPLDLALAIDTFDRAADALPAAEAAAARARLERHVDRILDAVRLQLPSEREDGASFAPVFDRRVCLRPINVLGATGWARPGDVIRYTISAENGSDETFTHLVLEDTLPDGVTPIETEPTGAIAKPSITWAFAELIPAEERTWEILARVDGTAPIGTDLVNCAVLTYTNLNGDPQPPREACASISIRTLEDGAGGLLADLPARYLTDEAMHLADTLADLSCLEPTWERAETARELAIANLGVLLGSSSLGVPLEAAPRLSSPGSTEALADLLDALAVRSGLPAAPILRPILLPFEAGMPVLEGETGFAEKSETITPAALGWALAAEVAFVDDCASGTSPLGTYLAKLVAFTIDNQVEWLAQMLLVSEAEEAFVPHGAHATIAQDNIVYSVSDPRSIAYDQASLLIGLVRVAESDALDRRTKLLAQQMASVAFDQLERHWDDASGMLVNELHAEVASDPAPWEDTAVVARSLAASASILPQRRSRAEELLDALARSALDCGRIVQRTAEAGRLTVLAVAARTIDQDDAQAGFTGGWNAYLAGDDAERSVLAARPDWTFTPGEIATRVALLSEVVRSLPAETTAALAAATVHVDMDTLAARVQLVDPGCIWLDHTRTPCSGLAPVFAHLRGPIPDLP